MKKALKSSVCVIANHLIKQGVSRSAAFTRAWITVKLRSIKTKTAGVTFGNRQTLLDRLSRYAPEDIFINLRREQGNAYDADAVAVVASVRGRGSAVMGYINRDLAQAIAPLLDAGKAIAAKFSEITGGGCGYNYGLNFEISF